jgi:hypothetical protein
MRFDNRRPLQSLTVAQTISMNIDTPHPPITIVIAGAVRLYREGLATALKAHEQLRIEGTAGTSGDSGRVGGQSRTPVRR